MGTSHRKMPVKLVVAEMRNGIAELLRAPDGYEIVCGNGGSTGFWDAAVFGLIDEKSHHLSFGEFGGKFAKAVAMAPHLQDPSVTESAMGTRPDLEPVDGVDAYAFTHNETSTGVMMDPVRAGGVDDLMLVDATSAAGGLMFDANATDVYYFAPQKALASDGGLWIAMMSPAAIERVERIANSGRYIPPSLNLWSAVENSRQDQTYNTPALATIFLTAQTVNWFNDNGGLSWSAGRSATSARDPLRLGRCIRRCLPVRAGRVRAFEGRRHDRLRRGDRRRHARRGSSQERHPRCGRLPQARSQSAPHRHVPGHRPGRHRGAHGVPRLLHPGDELIDRPLTPDGGGDRNTTRA